MRTFHLNDTTLLDFSQDAVGGNADVADESGVPDDVFNVQQAYPHVQQAYPHSSGLHFGVGVHEEAMFGKGSIQLDSNEGQDFERRNLSWSRHKVLDLNHASRDFIEDVDDPSELFCRGPVRRAFNSLTEQQRKCVGLQFDLST